MKVAYQLKTLSYVIEQNFAGKEFIAHNGTLYPYFNLYPSLSAPHPEGFWYEHLSK